jgi:hypothetical protein
MSKVHDHVPPKLAEFIAEQPMFFVASAPSGPDGHVNISPKGLPQTFALLDERRFVYLDLSGSGAETIAHVRQNSRLTVMFCAFWGPPRILRLYGTARYHPVDTPGFDQLLAESRLPPFRGMRALIEMDIGRVATSCGFGVPEMSVVRHRDHMESWANARTMEQILGYRVRGNTTSIDGLAAIDPVDAGSLADPEAAQ